MDMYREEILEHWQNPLNFGVIDNADLVIEQVNPLCGDEVTFYFRFSTSHPELDSGSKKIPKPFKVQGKQVRNDKWRMANAQWRIADVKFTGSGCAISIATASILSENIRHKKISTLSKITGEDVLKLIGGPVAPARLKCAFLSLEVVRKMTQNKEVVLDKLEQ